MNLPPRLPIRGPFAKLYEWLNALRDFVQSLSPVQSNTVRTTHTPAGVVRESRPGHGTGGETDDMCWL